MTTHVDYILTIYKKEFVFNIYELLFQIQISINIIGFMGIL